MEEHAHIQASEKLNQLGPLRPYVEAVLRHLMIQGTVTVSPRSVGSSPPPDGMDIPTMKKYLEFAVQDSFVKHSLGPNISGGAYSAHEDFYEITASMRTPLENLLYPSRAQSESAIS
jgi:hypothetical protein